MSYRIYTVDVIIGTCVTCVTEKKVLARSAKDARITARKLYLHRRIGKARRFSP